MRSRRFNTLPRAIGLTVALAVGSGALASCTTGERPSFEPSSPQEDPATSEVDCPAVSFTYPGSNLTPEEWRYRQHEEADLTLTDAQYRAFYQELVNSRSFETSAAIMESVLSDSNISVVVGETPDTLLHRPAEITQPLLDASSRNILRAYATLPKRITDLLRDTNLQVYLTSGIRREEGVNLSADYSPPETPGNQTQLTLDVSENTRTGDVFIWGLAQILAPKLCSPASTYAQFSSYNPSGFEYGMDVDTIYDQRYGNALVNISARSVHEDFTATLQGLLERGLDDSCRPGSNARYGSPDGEFVKDSGECRKGRYVLQVIAATDQEAAEYLAVPAYFSNGSL